MKRNKILREKAEALYLPSANSTLSALRSACCVYTEKRVVTRSILKENKHSTFARVRPQLSRFVFRHFYSVKLPVDNYMYLILAHVPI